MFHYESDGRWANKICGIGFLETKLVDVGVAR
jgi:hypothetical protein